MRGRAAAAVLALLLAATAGSSGAAAARGDNKAPDLHQDIVIQEPPNERWRSLQKLPKNGPGSFETCLLAIERRPGQVVLSRSRAMLGAAKTVLWGATPARPEAVFYAYSTEDVSASVACAYRFGVNVSPASGRQSFIGGAIVTGRLIVDVSNMTSNELLTLPDGGGVGVRVGPGNTGATLNAFINDNAHPAAAVPMGGCSWVGVSGYILGGGFGPLGRYLGYGCDSLLELEAVLADGSVVTANKDTNSDLFWASCGAGGGQFAVVTSLTLRVSTLPNDGQATLVKIFYEPGAEKTVEAFMAFQKALPALDRRLTLDFFQLGTGAFGPQFSLQGTFLGDVDEAYTLLSSYGLLSASLGYDQAFPSSSNDAATQALLSANFPKGVLLNDIPAGKFFEEVWLKDLAPTYTGTPAALFTYFGLPPGWNYQGTPEQVAFLDDLMHGGSAASGPRVQGGRNYATGYIVARNRLTGVLPKAAVEKIVSAVDDAHARCQAGEAAFCYLLVGNHVLGGAYTDAQDNAVPFRRALLLLNFGFFPSVASLPAGTASRESIDEMNDWSDELITSLHLYIGEQADQGAYVNYLMDDPGPKWHNLYWGTTADTLRRIKGKYDPRGRFDKPWTITKNGAQGR